MYINISEHIEEYKTKVLGHLDDLTAIGKLVPVFKRIDFSIESFDESKLKELEIFNVIYIVMIENFGEKMSSHLLCSKIIRLKDKQKKIKYPQVNMSNADIPDNNILYIGKSSGLFRKRFEQHLNSTSPSTYAMHMETWGSPFSDLRFKLLYTSIDNNILNQFKNIQAKDLLELVETSLHHRYKPLLGRTGH